MELLPIGLYYEEEATDQLRWFKRKRTMENSARDPELQRMWKIHEYYDGILVSVIEEWRPIPLVNEDD